MASTMPQAVAAQHHNNTSFQASLCHLHLHLHPSSTLKLLRRGIVRFQATFLSYSTPTHHPHRASTTCATLQSSLSVSPSLRSNEVFYKRPAKPAVKMKWLSRHLRKPASRPNDEKHNVWQYQDPKRPQTAPSSGTAAKHVDFTYNPGPPPPPPRKEPPPRPPRPDTEIIRDVTAWLDATVLKPAPVLMAGIPYWREGEGIGTGVSSSVRYASPIVHSTEQARPATSHSHRKERTFVRLARKMQVRMPSLLRVRSHRHSVKQISQPYRRSRSMPTLSPTLGTFPAHSLQVISRSQSMRDLGIPYTPTTASSQGNGSIRKSGMPFAGSALHLDSSASSRFDEQESDMERRVNIVFGSSPRGHGTRRAPLSRMAREDSMGHLSDVPSYTTGPPPPSYRSRPESRMTTSSFGCVDGMNAERRQLSQQRALLQRSRGMKGTFRKLAQRARLSH